MNHPRKTRIEGIWVDPATGYLTNPPAPTDRSIITLVYLGQRYTREVGPDDYVSQREAAALLGVTVMAVNKWVRNRKLRCRKRRGSSVIRLSDLKRFGKSHGYPAAKGLWFVG